jgi:hypothetical protein
MNEEKYKPKKEVYGRRAYIGKYQGEEFFLMPVKWDCGWYWGGIYLEGLRPYTEEDLRQHQRDQSPEDYGIKLEGTARDYFDEDRWRSDLEEEWYESGDVQAEQERNGKTYYLCFGTHTHFDSVLMTECGGTFKGAQKRFDELALTKEQFSKVIDIALDFYDLKRQAESAHSLDMHKYLKICADMEIILERYDLFVANLPTLPEQAEGDADV